MKEKILENINYFLEYIKQGTDFIKDQAPLYVQELITYHCVLYTSLVIFGVIGVIIALILLKKGSKYSSYQDIDKQMSYFISSMIIGIISLFFIGLNFSLMLKTWLAPRVFIMDYLMRLVGMK